MSAPHQIKYHGRLYKRAAGKSTVERLAEACLKACQQLGARAVHAASDDDREDLSVSLEGKQHSIVIKLQS